MRILVFAIALLASATAFGQKTITNIENLSGWGSCSSCAGFGGQGSTLSHYLQQGVSSPSLDGSSALFHISSGPSYTDVLWWKHVIDNNTTNGNTHHFVYDTYFYLKDPAAAQAIEFDITQYVGGHRFLFGTQCNIRGGHVWDVYNNTKHAWTSTGVYCATPTAYKWHHVRIEGQRTSSNQVRYVSIALDGNTHYINRYYAPTSSSYNATTINFQMDGNKSGSAYSTWLDKLTFTYW